MTADRKARLEKEGVTLLTHSIVQSPLPYMCEAIRFANVSMHLQPKERKAGAEKLLEKPSEMRLPYRGYCNAIPKDIA